MDDYREIRELLKPRRDMKASDELCRKVRSVLDRKRRAWTVKSRLAGGIGISAVAALLLVVLVPSGLSAREILAGAIDALGDTESIEMTVEVRTRPVENFRYIDEKENFVNHHILVVCSDSMPCWRIDKGGRVATGRGRDIYTWIPSLNLGWHISGSDYEDILGYMATLLKPKEILESELDNCINNSNAEYEARRTGDEIILTVHTAAQGNFENPYLLNTSITESESVRRYVLDAGSKRLKNVTVSVISGKRATEVLKVTDISYGKLSGNTICMRPRDIRFVEFENHPDGLRGLSAEEAASTFLNAFADWDEDIIDKMMEREMQDAAYRTHYRGARLDSIGRAFTSGAGRSVFVPYTLQLRDGTLQRHNIALQRTDSGGWIVTGGL